MSGAALAVLGAILAAIGAGVGLYPLWRPELKRRELLAVRAYRSLGYQGSFSFPVKQWPPLPEARTLLSPGGFLPGNLRPDPAFAVETQAISHGMGRPEDVDAVGWNAAADLRLTDGRLGAVAGLLIASGVVATALGFLLS
ncbi:MAG: hypothetical protein ACHQ2Y_02825 [Candidatus Lutacidiplasmatales archaeon]